MKEREISLQNSSQNHVADGCLRHSPSYKGKRKKQQGLLRSPFKVCCQEVILDKPPKMTPSRILPRSCLTESQSDSADQRYSNKAGVYCNTHRLLAQGRDSEGLLPKHSALPLCLLKAHFICAFF